MFQSMKQKHKNMLTIHAGEKKNVFVVDVCVIFIIVLVVGKSLLKLRASSIV